MDKNNDILTRAYNLFILGNYKSGINLLERYLKTNEGNGSIYTNLGVAYMKLENYNEAKKNFDKALESDKYPNNIYYNLAEYYLGVANKYKKENLAFAISQLKKALENIQIFLVYDETNEYAIELKNSIENYLN